MHGSQAESHGEEVSFLEISTFYRCFQMIAILNSSHVMLSLLTNLPSIRLFSPALFVHMLFSAGSMHQGIKG